jgi:serine/threonine protein kinase
MAIVSTGALIDALRRLNLLAPDLIAHLTNEQPGRCGEARLLARSLAQRGWLTIYQINELLAGRGDELVLGPYHILDRLGKGGLSQVYKARHADAGSIVALKVIKPEALASGEGRQQFLQEMEAMARLDHPNIVQFIDLDQAGDIFYFAMEFVEGTDLGKLAQLSGPMPVAQACDYIHQAALGLQHAHERHLIHRDIKPANLLLVGGRPQAVKSNLTSACSLPTACCLLPTIKILDWGLACLRPPRPAHEPDTLENRAKGIVGTADYLAPEQARDARAVDIRGDIYSLGCTFYYLLLGRPPFPNGTLVQKLAMHRQVQPRPVEEFRSDLPAGLPDILRRMLAKRPEDRFQTPAALALALLPYTHHQPRPSGGLPRVNEPTPMPAALGRAGLPLAPQVYTIGERKVASHPAGSPRT